MKKFVVVMVAMALLCALPFNALAEKLVINIGDWAPYMFMKDGKAVGSDVEIVQEIFKRMGIDVEFKQVPWVRGMKYVEEGKTHALISVKKTEERAKSLYFPDEDMNVEKLVIIAKKGSNIKADKLDNLKGKSIGVVREYSYGSEFDKYEGVKKAVCDDDTQMLRILDRGRVDMAVGDEGNLKYIAKQIGFQNKFETVYVLSESSNTVVFSKKALGNRGKEIAEKFGQTLRQMKEEGVIDKIKSKYF